MQTSGDGRSRLQGPWSRSQASGGTGMDTALFEDISKCQTLDAPLRQKIVYLAYRADETLRLGTD